VMNLDDYFCRCGREFKHLGPCWNRPIVVRPYGVQRRAFAEEKPPLIRSNPTIRGARFINGKAVSTKP